MTRSLAVATLALVPLALAAAPTPPEGIHYVTSVEGIHEYRLDNGLQLLLFPDQTRPTVTVNITYMVGSAVEHYGETGLAHILEHLLFKSSTHHPDISQELTERGARPNGTTWTERTNYFESFDATPENIEWALDLEADRMVHATLSPEDLESEMTVVRNEFEIRENRPAAVLHQRIYSTAYLWHNYANPTIGCRDDIENVPISRIRAFYEKWYRPDNAMLVVAGAFEAVHVLGLVKEKFGPLANPETPLPGRYTREPPQDGARSLVLRRAGDVQLVALAYHVPSGSHPDQPALSVLAQVLTDTPSGRLHESLVESGMATGVWGEVDRFRDPGLFLVSGEVRMGQDLSAVRDEMVRGVEGFADPPISDKDVERARVSLLSRVESTLRETSRLAIHLSEWAAAGDWRLLFLQRDRLEQVTTADVQRVARDYMVETNRTEGLFIPTESAQRVAVPENPDLDLALAGFTGREAMAEGEAFDPDPMAIEGRVIRGTLPNGLRLALLPRKTRGEVVSVRLRLHFGSEETLRGQATAGEMTGSMLMRGTSSRTREEVHDELDRLKARARLSGDATGANASVDVTRENLAATLEVVADVLRNPAFDPAEFSQLVEEQLAGVEESRNEPFPNVMQVLARHMNPRPATDVRYQPTFDEQLERIRAVELSELRSFHQRFYGASSAELAVVGDFDVDEIRALASQLFGDWISPTPFERLADMHRDVEPLRERIELADKESSAMSASLGLPIRDDHRDHPALSLASTIMGGGFLSSRLATRLRQNEGLCYGVGAWYQADRWYESANFGAYAMYAPQNDTQLMDSLLDELERAAEKGFAVEEVDAAREGWLKRRRGARGEVGQLAELLATLEHQDRTLTWTADSEERVRGLDAEAVSAAFRRWVLPSRICVVRAGTFEGAGVAERPEVEPQTETVGSP